MKNNKKYWAIYNQNGEVIKILREKEENIVILKNQLLPYGYLIQEIKQKISNRYPKIKIYKPKHKEKYKGNVFPLARSSWEYEFMKFLDLNDYVIEWASEAIKVPYINPIRSAQEKRPVMWWYYPDFFVKFKKDNQEWCELIEIKPYKQTIKPILHENKSQRIFQEEMKTYLINLEKWKAAQELCKKNGWLFRILTEKDLFDRQ